MKKLMYVILIFLVMTACSNVEKDVSYPDSSTAQLEQVLKKQEAIHGYKSVMNNGDLLVAVDIKRMKRFQKEKIEKNISKKLEEQFPDREVLVTSDIKVKWEIEKIIEKQLEKQELTDSIEQIKSLSKEET